MNIRIWNDPYNMRFSLRIYDRLDNEKVCVAEPIVMKEVDRFASTEPTISFDRKEELQDLLDDLWLLGLRPSARSDEYKAQLESVKDHLNDMRQLVFKGKRSDL